MKVWGIWDTAFLILGELSFQIIKPCLQIELSLQLKDSITSKKSLIRPDKPQIRSALFTEPPLTSICLQIPHRNAGKLALLTNSS